MFQKTSTKFLRNSFLVHNLPIHNCHGNPATTFWVILITDRETDRQTDRQTNKQTTNKQQWKQNPTKTGNEIPYCHDILRQLYYHQLPSSPWLTSPLHCTELHLLCEHSFDSNHLTISYKKLILVPKFYTLVSLCHPRQNLMHIYSVLIHYFVC